MTNIGRSLFALAGASALAAAALRIRREQAALDFDGKVVLITGASRGLGLGLAEELARSGARLAICSRHQEELDTAASRIRDLGAEVFARTCDVRDRDEVERFVDQVAEHYGRIDILINNAGIIIVGPVQNHNLDEFHMAMDTMYWGTLHMTLAVLPQMIERDQGSIVNITSIGGKLPVPHLSAYAAAKYAAAGFSETLTTELAGTGVRVTTVVPDVMRTGSYPRAMFKGRTEEEYRWFALGASLPGTSMAIERAVREILNATRRGDAVALVGWKSKIGTRLFGLMPDLMVTATGWANRLLPAPQANTGDAVEGRYCETAITRSFLTHFGRQASERYNEL